MLLNQGKERAEIESISGGATGLGWEEVYSEEQCVEEASFRAVEHSARPDGPPTAASICYQTLSSRPRARQVCVGIVVCTRCQLEQGFVEACAKAAQCFRRRGKKGLI